MLALFTVLKIDPLYTFANPAMNAMPSETDNSASYAVVSWMKFRPAMAMSLTNFFAMPPVPTNAS